MALGGGAMVLCLFAYLQLRSGNAEPDSSMEVQDGQHPLSVAYMHTWAPKMSLTEVDEGGMSAIFSVPQELEDLRMVNQETLDGTEMVTMTDAGGPVSIPKGWGG